MAAPSELSTTELRKQYNTHDADGDHLRAQVDALHLAEREPANAQGWIDLADYHQRQRFSRPAH